MGFPVLSSTTASTNTSRVFTRRTVSPVAGDCDVCWPATIGGSIVHTSANTHRKKIFFVLSTATPVMACSFPVFYLATTEENLSNVTVDWEEPRRAESISNAAAAIRQHHLHGE